jgi:hypothetical protein
MRTFVVRLLLMILSVTFPVILAGSILGWNRGIRDLGQMEATFVALLLILTSCGAFLAGYNLARGEYRVGGSASPENNKE